MRFKDKILCSGCGKFLFKSKKIKEEADKNRREGTRLNCDYYCKACQLNQNRRLK